MDRRRVIKGAFTAAGVSALLQPTTPAQLQSALTSKQVWNVLDFGAQPENGVVQTRSLQSAIDACSHAGGGTVLIPNGTFTTGTLELKDGVTLHLAAGAVLAGSTDPVDYPTKPYPARDLDIGGFSIWALVYASGAKNIGIEGAGTINGNGKPFPPRPHGANRDIPTSMRPRLIFLNECTHISVRDVTLRDSGCWTAHFARSSKITVRGIRLYSNFFYNQDGIVLDSCDGAVVSDCFVDASDDAVVIKSSFPSPCRNIVITNCVLTTTCAAIKFGSQSLGGFRNISISNCVFYECRLGGLKFEAVDGGDLEDISVSNVTMHNVSAPLTFILGNRAEEYGFKGLPQPRPVAKLTNVVVSGIRATVVNKGPEWHKGNTCMIAGLPGHPIHGLVLNNISMTYPGGGSHAEAEAVVVDRANEYPENTMLGVLPAYGLYLRHAKDIALTNIRIELSAPDARPALVCEDVEDLRVTAFRASSSGANTTCLLRDVRGALLQGCDVPERVDTFLTVTGARSSDIALLGNDLRKANQAVAKRDGFLGPVVDMNNLLPT